MVLVEVGVPSLRKKYDFKLDKHTSINDLIDEICAIICQKEQSEVIVRTRDMLLSVVNKEIIMNNMYSLADYNVVDGMELMLV